jgi:hypothetical protein
MNSIFPATVDNDYKGHKIALWFFYLITIVTVGRSLIHIFKHDGGAKSIATIPIDSFGGSGSEAIICIFALWGLSQLLIGIFYITVILRYKSLIPLMYAGLFLEYAGRWAITNLYKPIETIGQAPGGIANYILVALTMIMLYLSIQNSKSS